MITITILSIVLTTILIVSIKDAEKEEQRNEKKRK